MTTGSDWRARVGDVWAAEWRRTDRSLADLSRHFDAAILHVAPLGPAAVVDIGCGAGATSAALAASRPDLAITGVDLSPALLRIARERVPAATFLTADAAAATLPIRPDLLISRHGVMFFADPVVAFSHLREQAAPGAALIFSCFAARAENAFAGALLTELTGDEPIEESAYALGPFALALRERAATILNAAGWRAATAMKIEFGYVAGQGADPVTDAVSFLSRIGPLARIVAADPDRRHPLLSDALARYVVGDRVVLPASAWIWHATKGEA